MEAAVFDVLEGTGAVSANKPNIRILSPADVLETLAQSEKVDAVVLDPWYNKGKSDIVKPLKGIVAQFENYPVPYMEFSVLGGKAYVMRVSAFDLKSPIG